MSRVIIVLIFIVSFCIITIQNIFAQNDTTDIYPVYKDSPFYKNPDAQDHSLPYPFEDENENKPKSTDIPSPLFMENPENIKNIVIYDPETNSYHLYKKVGDNWYRRPSSMSFEEYMKLDLDNSISKYWFDRAKEEREQAQYGLLPGFSYKRDFLETILGKRGISVDARGVVETIFSINTYTIDNPIIPENSRKTTHLDFDTRIQFNLQGDIGDRMTLEMNYDSESVFSFDTRFKLNYEGKEDDIIKKIDVGNVSMPIPNTLIAEAHDLFGIKTELQFGKLFITSVVSQQRSETQRTRLNRRGIQTQDFRVDASDYVANKHFFLSKYFRDNYNNALKTSPIISSHINIQKIEVWVLNKQSNYKDSRNIIAFVDIGENGKNLHNPNFTATGLNTIPANNTNNLYNQVTTTYKEARKIANTDQVLSKILNFSQGVDYEKFESARKLSTSEYTFHPKLGYISLKRALNNDEILAVAYEYISQGNIYRVGEFSTDGPVIPNALYLKLLKGNNLSPALPTWDLMMKNVYSLGIKNFDSQSFMLDVLYQNDRVGSTTNYLPEGDIKGKSLISVLGLDNLNTQLDAYPDGLFDFIEGITVSSTEGLVFFPVVEPFGKYLRKKINNPLIADEYVFEELYTKIKTEAQQTSEKNKYFLFGQSRVNKTPGDVALDAFNVPEGSVNVTAGGVRLVENLDYIVDYTSGKVQVINPAILESGSQIHIQSENNAFFNLQSKTLLGTHLDYRFNENFNLGATLMYLQEKALYTKAGVGQEPFSNFMWGINGFYQTESPFLTRLVNKLPFIDTDAKSTINIEGEIAQIIPGQNKSIGGRAYIDDFEGSKGIIELRADRLWKLASVPQHQSPLFPEGDLSSNLASGYNRAKLAWYIIDPSFYRGSAPSNIDDEELSKHEVRYVREREVFPNVNIPIGSTNYGRVLNIAYYPSERGAYNFDVNGQPGISSGLNSDGTLKDPKSRWAGIMRDLKINNFDNANVEYIEFWLMDPFINNQKHKGGYLYFNLGNISEDILRDSRKSFENGLPTFDNQNIVDTTVWGVVPNILSVVNAFDNNAITQQDLGIDGLSTNDERNFFNNYLQAIQTSFGSGSQAYQSAFEDPSNDDYFYYRESIYDEQNTGILGRYKKFNLTENNTISDNTANTLTSAYTNYPDKEDINDDNTLNEAEAYYQYRVHLQPGTMEVGENYITDKRTTKVNLPNGESSSVDWYQFKIPVKEFDEKFGGISDFSSIRFIRMFLRDFEESIVLRFIRLNLVRNDWREYNYSLIPGNEGNTRITNAQFDLSTVSIEENNTKQPVNYVQPPDIERIVDPNNPVTRFLNEQALAMQVRDLDNNDSRATYKYFDQDIRFYKRLILNVHAEDLNSNTLQNDDLHLFIRLGSDFIDNYYEYELPLKITPPGFYNNNNRNDRIIVWPESNKIDIDLDLLIKAKLLRNKESTSVGGVDFVKKFSRTIGELDDAATDHINDIVSVKGNPSLSDVRTIMIGIRNPKDGQGQKSVEVWVNELRLSGFNDESGWAANLRTITQLADFGTVSISGNAYTTGFGAINQSVTERSLENLFRYDIVGNFELGKLFPKNLGLRIPTRYAISQETINPKYQAVSDQDVKVKQAKSLEENKDVKKSIKRASQTHIESKSINFTNVHIQKPDKVKNKILDVSNISLSFAYDKSESRNPQIESDIDKNYKGIIAYTYGDSPKYIYPFKKWASLSAKRWKLLKDFNFNFVPSQFSIHSEITRHYREIMRRNLIRNADFIVTPTYDKDFRWNRYYTFNLPISENLIFDFAASSFNRIDEPEGIVDRQRDKEAYKLWRKEVWKNIKDGGRPIYYNHHFSFNYNVPLRKIPFMDWTSLAVKYTGNYKWNSGPITATDTINIGNVITNKRLIELGGRLDMIKLYDKSKYLKSINKKFVVKRKPTTDKKTRKSKEKDKEEIVERKIRNLSTGKGKLILHNLGTTSVNVKMFDENNKPIKNFSKKVISPHRIRVAAKNKDLENVIVKVKPYGKSQEIFSFGRIGDIFVRFLMSVRNINFTYVDDRGTTLPGFLPSPNYLGLRNWNGTTAPGFGFVTGAQDRNFGRKAAEKNYLTTDNILNDPFLMNRSKTFDIRISLEPFKNLIVDLEGFRTYNRSLQEFYTYNTTTNAYDWTSPKISGNLSMSFISLKSSFFKIGNSLNSSIKYFDNFLENRKNVSLKLARNRYGADYINHEIKDDTGTGSGFYEGYGPTSQDVLVPSFQKAYGSKANGLLPSLSKILPNWRVVYTGLSNIDVIRRYVKQVNIRHTYRSTYEVGGFTTNLNYEADDNGHSIIKDAIGNYLPEYETNSVAITESFNPLLGIDMTFENSLTTHFEIKRQHNLLLNLINSQLIETSSTDFLIGASYLINDFNLFMGRGAKSKKLKNDLNVRLDYSIRKDNQIYRNIIDGVNQLISGQKSSSLRLSADYILNDQFNFRLFYDRLVNRPYVSKISPTINSNIGLSVTYTFKPEEKLIKF